MAAGDTHRLLYSTWKLLGARLVSLFRKSRWKEIERLLLLLQKPSQNVAVALAANFAEPSRGQRECNLGLNARQSKWVYKVLGPANLWSLLFDAWRLYSFYRLYLDIPFQVKIDKKSLARRYTSFGCFTGYFQASIPFWEPISSLFGRYFRRKGHQHGWVGQRDSSLHTRNSNFCCHFIRGIHFFLRSPLSGKWKVEAGTARELCYFPCGARLSLCFHIQPHSTQSIRGNTKTWLRFAKCPGHSAKP